MGIHVGNGAMTSCIFGIAPGSLVLPPSTVMGTSGSLGNCSNCVPFMNVTPFGLCMSLANPITAAQTAAAFGVLTPGACIPTPAGMWLPIKPTVLSMNMPMLDSSSMLMCAFGGVIRINVPGQFTVMA